MAVSGGSGGPVVSAGLARALKPRHLSMIALGGAIGAGLLVASSTAVVTAGPAVVLTYLLAGGVLVAVMQMLGEMSARSPQTGSLLCLRGGLLRRGLVFRWAGCTGGFGR